MSERGFWRAPTSIRRGETAARHTCFKESASTAPKIYLPAVRSAASFPLGSRVLAFSLSCAGATVRRRGPFRVSTAAGLRAGLALEALLLAPFGSLILGIIAAVVNRCHKRLGVVAAALLRPLSECWPGLVCTNPGLGIQGVKLHWLEKDLKPWIPSPGFQF